MSTREMVDTLMAGVRKKDIEVKEATSLVDLMQDDYPFYLDPMPNLYFTRDPAASIGSGMTINTMRTEARRRETLFLTYIHKYHKNFANGETSLWYNRTLPYAIEGGDELVLSDKVVAIGCSARTSAEGIEIVAKSLFAKMKALKRFLYLIYQTVEHLCILIQCLQWLIMINLRFIHKYKVHLVFMKLLRAQMEH